MKIIIAILVVLLLFFQYKLWVGDDGVPDVMHVQNEVNNAKILKSKLQERNKALAAEVHDLKQGLDAIEERARNELGMIRNDETFYQIIKPSSENVKSEVKDNVESNTIPLKSPSNQ